MLFPKLCVVCGQPDQLLCQTCLKNLGKKARFISSFELVKKHQLPKIFSRYITGVWYFWDYQDLRVKNIIYAYKFRQLKGLGVIFQSLFDGFFSNFKEAEVVPIAPNYQRFRMRGFDHVLEMVGKDLISTNLRLKRIKETFPQSQTSGFRERWKNLRQAFILDKIILSTLKSGSKQRKKTVFLIDDILTSGATAVAAAQAVQPYASKIYLIVLARA